MVPTTLGSNDLGPVHVYILIPTLQGEQLASSIPGGKCGLVKLVALCRMVRIIRWATLLTLALVPVANGI